MDTDSHGARSELQVNDLQMFNNIARAVNSDLELSSVLQRIVESVCELTPWDRCSIVMRNDAEGYTQTLARFPAESTPSRQVWPLATSSTRHALETDILVIPDAWNASQFPGLQEHARQQGYRSVLIAPLKIDDPPCAIWFFRNELQGFTDIEVTQAATIADQVAIAIRNAHLYESQRDTATRLDRLLDTQTELLQRVLDGNSLEYLAQAVADMVENPVIVLDQMMHRIAQSRDEFEADAWVYLLEGFDQPGVKREEIREVLDASVTRHPNQPMGLFMADAQTMYTYMIEADMFSERLPGRILATPLLANRQLLGYLLVLEAHRSFERLDEAITREAGLVLAVDMMHRRSTFLTEGKIKTEVLQELFSGAWTSESNMLERSAYLGVDLTAPNILLVIKVASRGNRAKPKPDIDQILMRLAPALASRYHGTAAVREGDDIVVIASLNDANRSPDWVNGLAEWTVGIIESITGTTPLILVSSVCARLDDYSRVWLECRRAQEICVLQGSKGVVRVSDLGSYQFLVSVDNSASVQVFIDDTLGKLIAYDHRKGADFLHTLQTFFRHNGALQQTADALYIHVSTLRYRLERVEQILDVNLSDSDTRFSLQLALRLAELHRSDVQEIVNKRHGFWPPAQR